MEDDWSALKAKWVNQVAKRVLSILEEAVKAQTGATTGKPKAKRKELVNPFLSQKELVEPEILDKRAVNANSPEYEAQLQKLLEIWPCDQHIGLICMVKSLTKPTNWVGSTPAAKIL
ncbi:hypothetical protein JB92DRAFT_2832112 [Gautieria morchelliformis]|nr:hypothetical protein JB92DRAFT_2832112 [Gautieria morchelliformis]